MRKEDVIIQIGDDVMPNGTDDLCRVLTIVDDVYNLRSHNGSANYSLKRNEFVFKGRLFPSETSQAYEEIICEPKPIDQEYIERFGFERTKDSIITKYFEKPIVIRGETFTIRLCAGFHYDIFDLMVYHVDGRENFLFDNFRCTTREQLRFLLSNGRIDCTK